MIKFPCGICSKSVNKNQRANCCDSCQSWIHIKCNNLDSKTYELLKASEEFWLCKICLSDIMPFSGVSEDDVLPFYNLRELPVPEFIQNNADELHKRLSDLDETPSQQYFNLSEFNNLKAQYHLYKGYFHLNIESLSAHIDELNEFLNISKINFDVICLTESRMQVNKKMSE